MTGTKTLICLFLAVAVALALQISSVTPAASGEKKPLKPGPKDKCPVCGMFVAKYPDFLAQIILKDGSVAHFDGAKDMFKYYFNMKKYAPGKGFPDIDSVYVTDYYTLYPADGERAFYVIGSNVFGPMGRELIPFEKEKDATEFVKDHKGKAILRFREITPDTIKGLD